MSEPTREEVEGFLRTFPGKRGIDIPEEIWDRMHPVAHGIVSQVWGGNQLVPPHQMQWLFDHGHHTPERIHGAYGELPHPHAPSIKVSEYEKYSQALQLFNKHQK